MLLVCLCSSCKYMPQITEDKICNDLRQYFSDKEYEIRDVTIERSQRNEKTERIDISLSIVSDKYTGKQYFTLIYGYYDRGGWMIDECKENKSENWDVTPNYAPEIDKKTITKNIFYRTNIISDWRKMRNGYGLKVKDAHFVDWTFDTKSDVGSSDKYIDNVKETALFDENQYIADIDISAHSELMDIYETIRFEWHFDEREYKWSKPTVKSIDHSVKMNRDLVGTYQAVLNSSDHVVRINKVSDKGEIYLQTSDNNGEFYAEEVARIKGLFSCERIKLYNDRFESNYFSYYYKNKM